MIDFHTFSQLKDMQNRQDLKAAQIADTLDLNVQTVNKYSHIKGLAIYN